MMTNQPQKTLLDVLNDVWKGRRYIAGCAITAAALALLFVTTATNFYAAKMVIAPANPMNGAEVGSLLQDESLSALRFLVQRSGVTNSAEFTKFENTYAGTAVAQFLIKDPKITEGLRADTAFSFLPPRRKWNPERLAEYIGQRVRNEPVGGTSLRRLSYLHPDPEFAVYFLNAIHRITDEMIRQKIKQEATLRVRYLEEAISGTANPDHRRALTALLMEQERLLMLVSIRTAYAASVVEPPAATAEAVWPDAVLTIAAFVLAGALAGFVLSSFASAAGAEEEKRRAIWFKTNSRNNNEQQAAAQDKAA